MTRPKFFILYLSLLHRFSICLRVNDVALSSQNLPEDSVVTVNIQKNFTKQFVEGDSSPASTSVLTDTEKIANEHWDLDRIFKVWDPIVVSRTWRNETYRDAGVSLSCGEDLTRYMTGASKRETWALKIMDADGRRTWGTFSGNTYWLGDADQCRQMENEFMEWQRDKRLQRNEALPPFRVSANSIKFALDILKSGLNGTRNVTLGLCLPKACDTKDVEKLLSFVQIQPDPDFPLTITINRVRNLSTGYRFWEDTIFQILLVSFVIVCVLTLIGTCYDIVLRYEILRKTSQENNDGNMASILRSKKLDPKVTFSKLWSVRAHNGTLDIRNSNIVPKPWTEALLSFSLLVNISKLCSLDVGADTLAPIHGLRFYTIIWVILLHTCLITNEISENKTFRKVVESDFLYQTVGNGVYSVDTFFFISGCLVTFLYCRTIANKKIRERRITKSCGGHALQFVGMIVYRYLRLTPVYLLIIGLLLVLTKWYYNYSMIELPEAYDYDTCEKFWWRNALYINTYFTRAERCMSWSWYLANDTQFYIVGTIILVVGANFLPAAVLIVAFFLIGSWVTTAIITLHTGHVPSINEPFAHYDSIYDKPWTKLGAYLTGMATGWYLFRIDCKINMNKVVVTFGWCLSLIIMVSIVYGLSEITFGPALSVLYTTLSHTTWAICLAWILIACVTGHGGIANHLLSWKFLYPISRLTYCVYLVHPIIIRAVILQCESSWYLSRTFLMMLFFGNVVLSYIVSLVLSLLFEAPMVSLLRILHPLREWKQL